MARASDDLSDGPVTKPHREPKEPPDRPAPRPTGPAGGPAPAAPAPRPAPPPFDDLFDDLFDDPIDQGPVFERRPEPGAGLRGVHDRQQRPGRDLGDLRRLNNAPNGRIIPR